MKHICYVYIYEYKCLKNIELVLDSHYDFRFSHEKRELTITKNEGLPTDFWGKNIYSVAAIIGNNGSGKSSAMSFLLDFLVEGSGCQSVNGVIVYEQGGEFFCYGKGVSVVFGDKLLKPIDSPMGLKDMRWKIPCLYHSGHFTPNYNDDPRNSHLAGSYIASDNVHLIEDLQEDTNENALPMHLPLLQYLNSHVAQNNYRICMMLANKELSGIIRDFAWPRYVVIKINKSGATAIENSIRIETINEKRRVVREKDEQYSNNENVTTDNKIAQVYENTEDLDRLLEYDNNEQTVSDPELSIDSPIATTYNNKANVYFAKGDYDNALEYYERALPLIESKLGKSHTDTIITYNNIAKAYFAKGDYDKALEFYEKVLKFRKSSKYQFNTTAIYNNLARTYYAKGNYDKALEYYNKLVNKSNLKYSASVKYNNNIAVVYYKMGDYDMALHYYNIALHYNALNTNYYLDTATIYDNMAEVYRVKKDYDRALEFYQKAMEIRKKELDEGHPNTIKTYNNIATMYYSKGDYDKALDYYNKVLDVVGKNHPIADRIYSNIANVYFAKGDYDKALSCYMQALEIMESKFGKNHPDNATMYSNIARVYSALGDYDKALDYYSAVETNYLKPTKIDEEIKLIDNNTISIPSFKTVFDRDSEDYFLSLLIYHNLLNTIYDIWDWHNGFDIITEWQDRIINTTPILEQLDSFINSINDIEKKGVLRSLYKMLVEIKSLTTFEFDSFGDGFLYIDCKENEEKLVNLGEKVLNNIKFYRTSKFFDFSFAQALDSETILSSGEQELLNLFSRLYDAIILRPNKFSNLQSPSLLMLDEAEIGFHPDWQRRYLKLVIDFIKALKTIKPKLPDFQIIISTHSPILLSDIPNSCTNYLKREKGQTKKANGDEIGETFAENVFQLYRKSFFMKDGLVGEFARYKIHELENKIDNGETEGVLNEIKMIGDDGIREYLVDKYQKKHPQDESLKEEMINYYEEKAAQLKKSIIHKDE